MSPFGSIHARMHGTVRRWAIALAVLLAASPAAADETPVELTILRTVNLPWQGPEAIVVATAPVEELVMTVSVDGGPPSVHLLDALGAGERGSITWSAPEGAHDCTVSVRGKRGGRSFELHTEAKVHVVPALELKLGEADVDIRGRSLRLHASQPASVVELTLFDIDGGVLHRAETEVEGEALSRTLRWPELHGDVARVAVRVFSTQDTWADASWSPIEIEVSHPPILFDPKSAPDRDALDAVYAAARKQVDAHPGVPGLALYVVGVGPQGNGKALARKAKHVARYLEKRGKLGVPVRHAVATGDGEDRLGEVHTILSSQVPAEAHWTPSR